LRPKLICVKCSSEDEQNNPICEDIQLVPIEQEFFGDDDGEFEVWQCIRCKYKLWLRADFRKQGE